MIPIPHDHFPRPVLARAFADDLLGADKLSDARNGVFLAGARRTGKTRFLTVDLTQELEQRGCLVLYADLWEDGASTPEALIRAKIDAALKPYAPALQKLAAKVGVGKINVTGAGGVDVAATASTAGLTLHACLERLAAASEKQLVLIVDEAQDAITSDAGQNAMRALKSARDQFQAQSRNLLLVMAGSHRDKLMRLVNSAAAPFWGSQVREMPLLADDYVAEQRKRLLERRPEWAGVRLSVLQRCFAHYGARPQLFLSAVNDATLASASAADFEDRLNADAESQRARERAEYDRTYVGLEPLQQIVFERMLSKRDAFRAYDREALAWYAQAYGESVSVAKVQTTLDALRERNLRLIWKELRGNYEVYDEAMSDWYDYLRNGNQWPPQ
jgi:hypothetical protein